VLVVIWLAYLKDSQGANRVWLQDRHKNGELPLLAVVEVLLDGLIQKGKILPDMTPSEMAAYFSRTPSLFSMTCVT
jgi:hypothetical protein